MGLTQNGFDPQPCVVAAVLWLTDRQFHQQRDGQFAFYSSILGLASVLAKELLNGQMGPQINNSTIWGDLGEIWLWWSKPFWDPILVGLGEFTTHFRLPILMVGLGCSLQLRAFDPWPFGDKPFQNTFRHHLGEAPFRRLPPIEYQLSNVFSQGSAWNKHIQKTTVRTTCHRQSV